MTTGKTNSGFAFELNEKYLRDARVIERLTQMENEDMKGLSFVLDALLGEDQKERLYDHVAENDPDGIANFETVLDEIHEMTESLGADEKK